MAPDPSTTKKCSGIENDAELVALWLSGRPATTVRAYQRDLLVFDRALTNKKQLPEVGLADLKRFVGALTGADASRARRVATLKSLLTFAHRVGYIEVNLGQLIPTPRIRSSLHERVLDEAQVERVVRQARRGRDRALVRTLYLGGLRISEALGLRWRDLGDRWLTVQGKGWKTRTVCVPPELVTQLRRLRARDGGDAARIFVRARGGALSVRQARAVITKLIDQAIGRPLPPHALRHSHATVALLRGAPIHLVQQTLGHASIAQTAKYLHVRPGTGSSQYLGTRGPDPRTSV